MSRSDEADEILSTLRRWLEGDVLPVVLELEHADTYPSALVEQMQQFGLFGATIPQEYGGLGLSASTYSKIVAAISETWMSLTGVINSHLMMAELVRRYGTDEQRKALLARFATGESRGGLALTEPDELVFDGVVVGADQLIGGEEASRLLVAEAAQAFDDGRRCDLEAGMAKLVATEAALENSIEALRIHAAYGYSTEDHIERNYCDAPLLCIGEGTNEIQRPVIARQLTLSQEAR